MRPNNWEGQQCPGVSHFQILSYYLVTAAVNCRKFCWNLLKSRARLFTSNDLWSRFEYLSPWYSKLIPKHTSNFSLKPSQSVLFLQRSFLFLSKWQLVLKPTCSTAGLHLARSHSWLYPRKPLAWPLVQEGSNSDVGATLRARWELTPQRARKEQGSALTTCHDRKKHLAFSLMVSSVSLEN